MAEQHIPLPLKYRPMTFEDVVGQEHVVKTLRHAIEANRVANAYLFIGPRGIGKTSMSRIFAKALNCLEPKGLEPCGQCVNCQEIAAGHSLDVTELDAASHNGVEDVRPIIETVQYKPTHAKYKIFIIDECHMLSKSAWNALLKTLEEPPAWARFIFATTEGDKVLPTIISRCQRFDLRRIQTHDIVARLKYICTKEGIQAEDDALLAIARGAEGGMRDALSSLDQLISFHQGHVTEEAALNVFGLVSRAALEQLAGAILTGDTAQILSSIEQFDSAGKNMRRLSGELLLHFRNLVVVQALGAQAKSLEATPEQIQTLAAQAQGIDAGRVFRICDQLAEMEDKLRYALSVRTLIEMSLIRASRIATTATVEELMKAVRALRSGGADAQPAEAGLLRRAAPRNDEQSKSSLRNDEYGKSSLRTDRRDLPCNDEQGQSSLRNDRRDLPSLRGAVNGDEAIQPSSSSQSQAREAILNDPVLNDILMSFPGSSIKDIKEKSS